MEKSNLFKQVLIVIGISAAIGIAVNFANPRGIDLIMDKDRYEVENSDKLKEEFKNQKMDSGSTTVNKNVVPNPNMTKEGFVKPQNIKIDFAKILYDKDAPFIDGRTREEFAAGHIEGAVNIPYVEFVEKTKEEKQEIMKAYNKDGIIVCYCKGGECGISIDLAYEIAKLGFNSVNIYLGGYNEWEKQDILLSNKTKE